MAKYLITLAVLLTLASGQVALSSEPAKIVADREAAVQTESVRIDGSALFQVRGISAHPARERAAAIADRIIALADDPELKVDSIVAVESDHSSDIMAGDRFIMSVFDADAELDKVPRQILAKVYVTKIRATVEAYRRDRGSRNILRGAASALGATLGLIALVLLIDRAFRRLIAAVEVRFTARIRELQAISHDIVRTEWIWGMIRGSLKAVRVILILLAVFFYISLVLSLFPWTRTYATLFLDLVLAPLGSIGTAVLEYLPKLVFLIILFFVARYALNLLRAFFLGVERGTIRFSRFDAEWAIPTYKIVRLAVFAFTVVVAYPYIPGSESPAFKGLSLFLGVIVSLGSSSAISNIVAGYMLTYRRAYKLGDRVRIGEVIGDVAEIRLQVTHLHTVKNEEIIVPNSTILNSHVVNYSSLARTRGLILHTTVGIGYETSWRQVDAMLRIAADRTAGLLKEPAPFVLQTSLGDFCVTYELNAYSNDAHGMAALYSEMHRNILDVFNEYGVQIMTPAYEGDPAQAKVVPKEQWYQPPAKPDDQTVDG
ncbi:MAG TPA: mechanosensitive ion channel family protein [Nitrospirota bacterium]|nr:mechanosensitive ion channel family protein [Nitrospirota bacterium]